MSRNWPLATVVLGIVLIGSLRADEAKKDDPKKPSKPVAEKPAADKSAADRYKVPEDADVETLLKFAKDIQNFQPSTVSEVRVHQQKARVAIADAARAILKKEKDTKSEAYLFAKTTELGAETRSLIAANEEERKEFRDQVLSLLENPHAGRQQLSLAMSVASFLEQKDEPLAIDSYKKFGAALEKSSDPKLAEYAGMLTGSARRLELPGHNLKLSAKRVDGKKFDISELKGKVVLVDFWATWCGPCIGEIPNMKKMYEQYHDHGFEIVGLSIDEDRQALDDFLTERKLPWIILHDEAGWKSSVVSEYGIAGIPTMFLVGKDGKVLDIHARGERLRELLEKQFASAETTGETKETDK